MLVFDGNGFIAGIQTIVPKDKALNDQYHQFSTDKFYQTGSFFGDEVYFATTYFVDPSIICNGGRTQSEFDNQGTGNLIAMQTGPTIADLHYPPLTQDDAMGSVNMKDSNNAHFALYFTRFVFFFIGHVE